MTSGAGGTIRRYAHELFPHADEYEVRPLSVEVPYLYARAIGLNVWETGWFDAPWKDNAWASEATSSRMMLLIEARHKALTADALLQGMAGDEAWKWATERMDEEGGWVYDRAIHYGISPEQIRPYPCGGREPDRHDHYAEADARGWQKCIRIEGPESDCPDCTEETEASR